MTLSQLHILQYHTVDATTRGCIIMLQICTLYLTEELLQKVKV